MKLSTCLNIDKELSFPKDKKAFLSNRSFSTCATFHDKNGYLAKSTRIQKATHDPAIVNDLAYFYKTVYKNLDCDFINGDPAEIEETLLVHVKNVRAMLDGLVPGKNFKIDISQGESGIVPLPVGVSLPCIPRRVNLPQREWSRALNRTLSVLPKIHGKNKPAGRGSRWLAGKREKKKVTWKT